MKKIILLGLASLLLFACTQDKTLKIAATSVPHAEILEVIREDLEEEGIVLKIVEVDDYNLPNRLLYEKQVDANFFQHEPYLELQNQQFNHNLVPLVAVHVEPLGIYSDRITDIEQVKEGAIIAIPSDPSNESRALALLADLGLITLKKVPKGQLWTLLDVEENFKNIRIEEIDTPFLPRSLKDVLFAVIPLNFALQAHFNPQKDALVLEPADSPYVNVVVIRKEDLNRSEFEVLKKALQSEKLRQYLIEKYQGALIPAF